MTLDEMMQFGGEVGRAWESWKGLVPLTLLGCWVTQFGTASISKLLELINPHCLGHLLRFCYLLPKASYYPASAGNSHTWNCTSQSGSQGLQFTCSSDPRRELESTAGKQRQNPEVNPGMQSPTQEGLREAIAQQTHGPAPSTATTRGNARCTVQGNQANSSPCQPWAQMSFWPLWLRCWTGASEGQCLERSGAVRG